MFRAKGLNQHATPATPAAGSARDLSDQVKRTLGGAKVGQMLRRVGIDHANERDVWKIETLGDHLRAEQDVNLPPMKC